MNAPPIASSLSAPDALPEERIARRSPLAARRPPSAARNPRHRFRLVVPYGAAGSGNGNPSDTVLTGPSDTELTLMGRGCGGFLPARQFSANLESLSIEDEGLSVFEPPRAPALRLAPTVLVRAVARRAPTHSGHRHLPEAVLAQVLGEVGALIDAVGGQLDVRLRTSAILARHRTPTPPTTEP